MKKNDKAKAHAKRMEEKRLDKTYTRAVHDTCRLVLLVMYAALVEEFKFDIPKLNKIRKIMDRYSVYIADGTLTQEEMMKVLADKGIDVTKIGDEV